MGTRQNGCIVSAVFELKKQIPVMVSALSPHIGESRYTMRTFVACLLATICWGCSNASGRGPHSLAPRQQK